MYNRWRDKFEHSVAVKKVSRRQMAFMYWPADILGWVRIPALIAGIAGLIGILRFTSPETFKLLKPLNLPSIEVCWVMLASAIAVYILCLVCWLSPKEDTVETLAKPEETNEASSAISWRGL